MHQQRQQQQQQQPSSSHRASLHHHAAAAASGGDLFEAISGSLLISSISRMISFGCTLLSTRYSDKADFGIMSVSLQSLLNFSTFFLKEVVRRAYQRGSAAAADDDTSSSVNNTAVWGTTITYIITPVLGVIWYKMLMNNNSSTTISGYDRVWICYGMIVLAVYIEAAAEPYLASRICAQPYNNNNNNHYHHHQQQQDQEESDNDAEGQSTPVSCFDPSIRTKAESVSLLIRSITQCMIIIFTNTTAILAFSIAQLVYAISWYVMITYPTYHHYYHNTANKSSSREKKKKNTIILIPHRSPDSNIHCSFIKSFAFVGLQKLLLQEGERLLLMAAGYSPQQWGCYGVVSNIGSMICRIAFAPIEDVAFSTFTSLYNNKKKKKNTHTCTTASSSSSSTTGRGTTMLLRTLSSFMLVESGIGFIGVSFGPPVSHCLIDLLYGDKWSSSSYTTSDNGGSSNGDDYDYDIGTLLSYYCYLLLLMSVNGISEAYYYATTPVDTNFRTGALGQLCASIVMLFTALVTKDYIGTKSLILANSLACMIRISTTLGSCSGRTIDSEMMMMTVDKNEKYESGANDCEPQRDDNDDEFGGGRRMRRRVGQGESPSRMMIEGSEEHSQQHNHNNNQHHHHHHHHHQKIPLLYYAFYYASNAWKIVLPTCITSATSLRVTLYYYYQHYQQQQQQQQEGGEGEYYRISGKRMGGSCIDVIMITSIVALVCIMICIKPVYMYVNGVNSNTNNNNNNNNNNNKKNKEKTKQT